MSATHAALMEAFTAWARGALWALSMDERDMVAGALVDWFTDAATTWAEA